MEQREKQIEEMAREMCHLSAECKTCQICNERYHGDDDLCYFQCVAKEIINHGYRKQSEGEWVQGIDNSKVCSICGKEPLYTASGTVFATTFYRVKSNYCPNCGANMKGGEQNDN
jgi:hypothetical protein